MTIKELKNLLDKVEELGIADETEVLVTAKVAVDIPSSFRARTRNIQSKPRAVASYTVLNNQLILNGSEFNKELD
jgi:NAD(P)H-hydrate repair Nnr-like enzyme with NAD(P)H-hydrate epimerase domain